MFLCVDPPSISLRTARSLNKPITCNIGAGGFEQCLLKSKHTLLLRKVKLKNFVVVTGCYSWHRIRRYKFNNHTSDIDACDRFQLLKTR